MCYYAYMAKKYIIDPTKWNYDSELLKKYLDLDKIIKDLCMAVPDSEWTALDGESLIANLNTLYEYAVKLTAGRTKK